MNIFKYHASTNTIKKDTFLDTTNRKDKGNYVDYITKISKGKQDLFDFMVYKFNLLNGKKQNEVEDGCRLIVKNSTEAIFEYIRSNYKESISRIDCCFLSENISDSRKFVKNWLSKYGKVCYIYKVRIDGEYKTYDQQYFNIGYDSVEKALKTDLFVDAETFLDNAISNAKSFFNLERNDELLLETLVHNDSAKVVLLKEQIPKKMKKKN